MEQPFQEKVEQASHDKAGQASVPAKSAQQASSYSNLDPRFFGPYLTDAELYRRRLPHLRLDGATYFITWRLLPGKADLSAPERTIIKNALHHFDQKRYRLFAFVVMNDHVHVLFEPIQPWRLSQITHSWKSFTANQMQKSVAGGPARLGPVWQDESFDRIVRTHAEFTEKAYYILNNPSKRWRDTREYAWLWATRALVEDVGLSPCEKGDQPP